MSEIRVNKVTDEAGTGPVELTQGATIPSGKSISGSGTIDVDISGTAGGLSGTPDITVNNIIGVAATFTGVLTYEDITNVDAVGLVTAQSGIRIGTGGTVGPVGAGIVTYFGDGSQLTGIGGGLNPVNFVLSI